jgi:hypothetical protein
MRKALVLVLALAAPAFAQAAAVKNEAPKRPLASANFKVHPCEQDALAKADKLIRLHFMDDSNATNIENLSIDDDVVKKAPIKAPVGKGKFDVLEVNANIYKGNYRMRFIYAQIKESCVLMGQEILEIANPY